VNFARIISRRIRSGGNVVRAVGDVNAAIAANAGESGSATHVSTRQRGVHSSGAGEPGTSDSTNEEATDERTRG